MELRFFQAVESRSLVGIHRRQIRKHPTRSQYVHYIDIFGHTKRCSNSYTPLPTRNQGLLFQFFNISAAEVFLHKIADKGHQSGPELLNYYNTVNIP